LLEVLAGVPVTEVAGRYGVSRQSVHAWLVGYRDEGPRGLEDRSHKVHANPWQIPAELEAAVCELRRAHRKWGPKRLVSGMGRRGLGTVTRSTVYRVLDRNQRTRRGAVFDHGSTACPAGPPSCLSTDWDDRASLGKAISQIPPNTATAPIRRVG
jgi:transposase-like protein